MSSLGTVARSDALEILHITRWYFIFDIITGEMFFYLAVYYTLEVSVEMNSFKFLTTNAYKLCAEKCVENSGTVCNIIHVAT